jgi:hypothetical protein
VERKKEWKEGIEKAGAPPFSRLSREGGDFDLVNPGEDLKVQDCKREARLSDEPDYVGTDAIGCPAERSSALLGERERGWIDANSQKPAIELRTLLLQRRRRARAHHRSVLICRPVRRIAQRNELPRRIIGRRQRNSWCLIHNRQHLPTAHALNG